MDLACVDVEAELEPMDWSHRNVDFSPKKKNFNNYNVKNRIKNTL